MVQMVQKDGCLKDGKVVESALTQAHGGCSVYECTGCQSNGSFDK